MVNHAFGTSKNRISTLQSNFISQEFSLERKQREDKGSSIFNSSKKRKSVFTAYNNYEKQEYKKFRLDPGRFP